jgi:hypothetical protein
LLKYKVALHSPLLLSVLITERQYFDFLQCFSYVKHKNNLNNMECDRKNYISQSNSLVFA